MCLLTTLNLVVAVPCQGHIFIPALEQKRPTGDLRAALMKGRECRSLFGRYRLLELSRAAGRTTLLFRKSIDALATTTVRQVVNFTILVFTECQDRNALGNNLFVADQFVIFGIVMQGPD